MLLCRQLPITVNEPRGQLRHSVQATKGLHRQQGGPGNPAGGVGGQSVGFPKRPEQSKRPQPRITQPRAACLPAGAQPRFAWAAQSAPGAAQPQKTGGATALGHDVRRHQGHQPRCRIGYRGHWGRSVSPSHDGGDVLWCGDLQQICRRKTCKAFSSLPLHDLRQTCLHRVQAPPRMNAAGVAQAKKGHKEDGSAAYKLSCASHAVRLACG